MNSLSIPVDGLDPQRRELAVVIHPLFVLNGIRGAEVAEFERDGDHPFHRFPDSPTFEGLLLGAIVVLPNPLKCGQAPTPVGLAYPLGRWLHLWLFQWSDSRGRLPLVRRAS